MGRREGGIITFSLGSRSRRNVLSTGAVPLRCFESSSHANVNNSLFRTLSRTSRLRSTTVLISKRHRELRSNQLNHTLTPPAQSISELLSPGGLGCCLSHLDDESLDIFPALGRAGEWEPKLAGIPAGQGHDDVHAEPIHGRYLGRFDLQAQRNEDKKLSALSNDRGEAGEVEETGRFGPRRISSPILAYTCIPNDFRHTNVSKCIPETAGQTPL